jgi:hypothetical protein
MTAIYVRIKYQTAYQKEKRTFMTSAATATDPHQSVQECVPFITSFHRKVDAVLIAAGVNTVRHVRINDLLENILGTGQPSFRADDDECWWLIDGLENITGAQVGSRVLGNDLGILATGLYSMVRHMKFEMTAYNNVQTYQDNSLAPSAGPLTTDKRDPLSLTPDAGADRDLGVHLDAHAEVQLQRRRGDLQ